MKKKLLIPVFLAALVTPLAISQSAEGLSAAFIGENNKNTYIAYGSKLNGEICDEGFVLLKNENNFLPMRGTEKISVVGKSSTSLVQGGGGSGSGSNRGESAIDLQKSLTDVGFSLNGNLTSFYKDNSKSGNGRTNGNSGYKGISEVTIGETPISSYPQTLLTSLEQFNDCAIQVISREGSEGCDVKTCDVTDSVKGGFSTKHALQLSDNEQDLFDLINQKFENIIILINSGNIFQCDQFENNPKVKAILWMGTPGCVGAGAVGRILAGRVNPSGRTVDTWARKFNNDPTWQNFSANAQTGPIANEGTSSAKHMSQDTMFNPDGSPVKSEGTYRGNAEWENQRYGVVKAGINGVRPASYVSYEEGIYCDYRYYETRYADLLANGEEAANEWYNGDNGVIYPFGYGLSYTKFEQEIVSSTLDGQTINSSNSGKRVEVTVKVKNTGTVAGKDVVQLYWRAPYEEGGIEKADRVLCAFAKSKMLEPNEEQELTLKFYPQDVANYDFSDANNNGFMGYELDGGDYQITLNKNAHEIYDAVDFKVAKGGVKYKYDRYTGNKVENRFSDDDFYSSLPGENDVEFTQFSRKNFEGTFPHFPTTADRTLKEGSRVEEFLNHRFHIADVDVEQNFEYVPEEVYKTKEDIEELGWSQPNTELSKEESIQINTLIGVPLDDPRWEELMNQMTYAEMMKFVVGGGSHNPEIKRMGKEGTGDSDGPSQFQIIWWVGAPIVAATYNVELARKQGEAFGMEGHINGTYGWAGPACNIHRSPFGGRNFEYYAADPFLSGRICGRVVAGATDRGIYCYYKHFVVNDQEQNREGVVTYITEQALREIYAKPFQMAIQEGKSMGIMSSYNRLGLMETAASYPLLTEVLRNEWGFKGHIISDMTHRNSGYGTSNTFLNKCYENINNRLLAGCNQQLDGNAYTDDVNCYWDAEKGCPVFKYDGEEYESYTWWYAVREMCKGCLYSNVNSGVMSKTLIAEAEGVTFSGVENKQFETRVGEDVCIEIELPEALSAGQSYQNKTIQDVTIELDETRPLPNGLVLKDDAIQGKAKEKANTFVHILVKLTMEDASEVTLGTDFELLVLPKAKSSSKGCGGSIMMTASLISLLAFAGVGALLLKKRKED